MGRQARKKASGQIDKLKREIELNPRLETVFSICKELGIDDPICWMNNTSPLVIDWWIAFESLRAEREAAIYKNSGSGQEMSGEDAGKYLTRISGQ